MQEAANYNKVYDSFDFEKECEIAKSKVVLKEDREAFIQFYDINNLKKLLSKDKLVSISYHVKENKSIYKKLVTAYYLDDQKSIIVLTRRDITKLAEEDQRQKKELQEAVERANAANKAKSDFLSHMSHDLRTPLNAVLAFSNPVLLDKASPEELRSYLNKVNVSGEYLLGIINDVLDMSRIEQNKVTLNPEPYYLVDFQNTINNVIGELSAKKNIEFIMDVHKASSKGIVVDRVRFNQIFVNLLSNAVKFTPSGGRVEFILDEEKRIEGNKVLCRFIVRDNGIGMSTDFIPHAFDSFHQEYRKDVAERYQGTGLGLPIVKELVRLMSGSIELVSEINCGTTFTVSIPFEEAELLMEKVPVPKQDYSRLCGIHILLVEDNEINLEIVQALLSKYECLVECAEDGEIAINKFKASPIGYYNIILMDIRMPGMDGITATKLIRTMDRSDARTVPIIATTADAFSEDEQLANDAGMNAHIAKPINPDRLYETCCRFVM